MRLTFVSSQPDYFEIKVLHFWQLLAVLNIVCMCTFAIVAMYVQDAKGTPSFKFFFGKFFPFSSLPINNKNRLLRLHFVMMDELTHFELMIVLSLSLFVLGLVALCFVVFAVRYAFPLASHSLPHNILSIRQHTLVC